MTESIFVPFKLTTREACEKAAEVLLGPSGKRIESGVEMEYVTGDALRDFTEALKRKRKSIEASK